MNPRVAGFSLVLYLGAGLLAGLLPAWSTTVKRRLLSSAFRAE